ncbi:hypothetical protein TRIP_B30038 [uncultured Desulfatiglans sp.]|nr:hypothetical protein TRIP_B30038 [uncultured Desulfatiglans sp.]
MFAILHRKNSLLHKTQRKAYVRDLFISLIYDCQLSGVNPLDYLKWLPKNTNTCRPPPFRPSSRGITRIKTSNPTLAGRPLRVSRPLFHPLTPKFHVPKIY